MRARSLAIFVGLLSACHGDNSAPNGPGGGSALCGANGTNQCGMNKMCDSTLGCVECVNDSNCPASARFCEHGSGVECTSNTDCGMGTTPACWPKDHTCHAACTSDLSCPGD